MNITRVDQIIKVAAVFEGANIKPRWFTWVNRKFEVKKIAMTWKSYEGAARLVHFSVTDGSTLYEITFNNKNYEWRLDKIATE
jgi:hypothetical protein